MNVKNLIDIYRLMFRYWGYILGGVVTMLLYAGLSGVSITLVAPLLDIVFKATGGPYLYHNQTQLWSAIFNKAVLFLQNDFSIWHLKELKHSLVLTDMKSIIAHTEPMTNLWAISWLVIGMFIIKNIFFYSNKYMFTNLRGRTVRDIRNQMFSKYLDQSFAFFNQNRVGDSLVRMVNDVDIISLEFISNLFVVLRDLCVMISCMVVAYFMNPRLFLISLLVTPGFALSISYIGKKIKKYARRIQVQYSNMFSQVEEALSSMRIVKAFAKEDFELNNYKVINNRYRKLWQKVEMYNALNMPISEISSAVIGSVLILVAGHDLFDPSASFTFGKFTAFMVAIFATMHPLKTLTKAYADIKKALVSLERVSYVLDLQTEVTEVENPVIKSDFINDIRFQDVCFSYGNGKTVLSHVNLNFQKGEKIAIIGSSGSGKTTMVNLLNRMYDCTSGEILIDDVPIRQMRIKALRGLFGVVSQESVLFSNSVRYNIQYGNLNPLSEEEIKHACDIAYASEFIELFPDKYDEVLQTKASNLSGGQKQRLCIARAIAADPPILIFDEATSALDTDSERKVQDAIDRATENRTVFVIAHRLSTIVGSDKIVVLEKGKVVGVGKHSELIVSCERYQQLYHLQFDTPADE